MKIKIGDIVESEFGCGKVRAFTEQWVIHDDSENGRPNEQYAVFLEDSGVWVPLKIEVESSEAKEFEL